MGKHVEYRPETTDSNFGRERLELGVIYRVRIMAEVCALPSASS